MSGSVADDDMNRERPNGTTDRRRGGTAALVYSIPWQRGPFPHSQNYLENRDNPHPCCLRRYVATQVQAMYRGPREIEELVGRLRQIQ